MATPSAAYVTQDVAMSGQPFPLHHHSATLVNASVERVFAYLDDPKSFAAHMGESSMMTMGMRMVIDLDAKGGRETGSKICMQGSMLGIRLALEEVVTEREPPRTKVWETIGTPHLLVIAHYRMGFEVTPEGGAAHVRVFIDYSLPVHGAGAWLGYFLGGVYARWCVKQMVNGVNRHFNIS